MSGINRVTVVEHVYHQTADGDIRESSCGYEQALESDSESYQVKLKITEEPKKLDLGWLAEEGVSRIHLFNRTGMQEQKLLNSDEKYLRSLHRILLFEEGSSLCWVIPPKSTFHGMVTDATALMVRAEYGEILATLTVYPL